jgi:hypothetical protein
MFSLSGAILMRAPPKLSLLVRTHTVGSIRLSLRNLVNPWMILLLGSSPLSVIYVLVVLLLTLIMNVLNNRFMLLMIMFGGMKITILKESADFATLYTKKLFSKLKSHELSKKGRPSHDASLSSKALITSARVSGHDANPTNTTVSSAWSLLCFL